jgi:peptidoglycan/xylan/chitin deacetylase (PgdA/CDA1 family)
MIPLRYGLTVMCLLAMMASVTVAGAITTVPWNGYPGAVSFTFDDALESQLNNVVPALKQRNIHATFFLYDVGGTFTNNKDRWIAAAKDGNELANHSLTHADFSTTIDAQNEVSEMATRLRNADASVQANTFAYPFCAIGYESVVQSENIIGRGCWFMAPFNPMQWSSPPSNWNNVGAIYVSDDATATGATIDAIDAAKNGGWIVTLNHGVGGDWVAVTKENVYALFDRAIQNGLWVGTYMEVAAYWRAGIAMDAVDPVKTNTGWTVSWNSPHAKMPKSVPLKIRLDAATFGSDITVLQNGNAIPPNGAGEYQIEFMSLGLTIQTGSISSSSTQQTAYSSATLPGTIQVENYDLGGDGTAYYDSDIGNSGNNYRNDNVDLELLDQGNYALGWTVAGEWLEYTIQIQQNGILQYTARVASGFDSSAFHLEIDGVSITPSIIVPNTGGWTSYQDVTGSTKQLNSGQHILRLVIDKPYCNIDWVGFFEPAVKILGGDACRKPNGRIPHKVYDMNGKIKSQSLSKPSTLPKGLWAITQ